MGPAYRCGDGGLHSAASATRVPCDPFTIVVGVSTTFPWPPPGGVPFDLRTVFVVLVRRCVVVAVLAVVLAACRVGVATEIEVGADGSGALVISVQVDAETADTLTTLGLSLRPPAVAGWQSDETVSDEFHEVVVSTQFASAQELAVRVEELSAGLDEEDPAVLRDVVLMVAEDGAATFDGLAGLQLPSSAGADAPGWPTAEELRTMADDVTASLQVTFPGTVETSNASTVAGRTATWDLTVGTLVPVSARSAAPSVWQQDWVRWTVIGVGVLVLLTVVVLARRSRRRHVEAPLGRVDRMRRER